MLLVDTIMVGRYDSQELAYMAISLTIIQPLFVFGVGLIMGSQIMTSINYGAGKLLECGLVWKRGALYAFVIGSIFAFFAIFGEDALRLTGQSENLAIHGGEIILISGYSLPFVLVFLASSSFLEGIKRPMPGVLLLFFANLANLLLNWIMIYGNLGAPEMGAVGAVWATNICRLFIAIGILVYILKMHDHDVFGLHDKFTLNWQAWKRQRVIGYATGLTIGVESIAFNGLGVLAGWMGALSIGAHAIVMNLLILAAMVSIGIGSATSIQVGIATGNNDHIAVKRFGWTGAGLVAVIVGVISMFLILFPLSFAALYTQDIALMDVVVPAIVMLGAVVVFDGAQLVLGNALRGRGETWVITIMNFISFLIFMFPLAWWLSIKLDRGIIGLYEAVFLSCILATTMFAGYFHLLTIKDQRQATM